LTVSVVLSLLVNVFFGRALSARISTLPLLNRWKILSPQAPIVINTREEVRVSDTTDVPKIISAARPKLSGVFVVSAGKTSQVGAAVNLTSDGTFLTVKKALEGQKTENLYIKLDDGTTSKIVSMVLDPATNLVLLKTELRNVPTAALGASRNLSAGDRIFFLAPTEWDFSPSFQNAFVSQRQQSDAGTVYNSDLPRRSFAASSAGALVPGQAVINLNGEVVGVWDGSSLVSSDVIQDFSSGYFSNNSSLSRPAYGFTYRNISSLEAKLGNLQIGAMVVKVNSSSAAQKAGLKEGDIITAINDTALAEDKPLENYLQKYRAGDKVKFSVVRDGGKIDINIAVGELK